MSSRQKKSWPVSPALYDRSYFLGSCGGHELYRESRGALLDERLSIILQMAGVGPGMSVLDLGCGRGELVRHCMEAGAKVWGVDLSWEAIRISRETLGGSLGRAGLCLAHCRHLPFGDGLLHRVLLSDILEHLTREELRGAVREVHRVLRPGGLVVFHTFPNRWFYNLFYPLKRLFWDIPRGKAGPRNPRSHYEKILHVQELSPWGLRKNFRPWFRIRMWCAHRSRWDPQTRRFRARGGPLALLREPELWGMAWKR